MDKLIYLGPNSKKLGLMRNTVYDEVSAGLPAYVKAAIEKVPEVERLLASVEDIALMQEQIRRKGTPEHRAYEVVAGVR